MDPNPGDIEEGLSKQASNEARSKLIYKFLLEAGLETSRQVYLEPFIELAPTESIYVTLIKSVKRAYH